MPKLMWLDDRSLFLHASDERLSSIALVGEIWCENGTWRSYSRLTGLKWEADVNTAERAKHELMLFTKLALGRVKE